jgi:hypothetical protein
VRKADRPAEAQVAVTAPAPGDSLVGRAITCNAKEYMDKELQCAVKQRLQEGRWFLGNNACREGRWRVGNAACREGLEKQWLWCVGRGRREVRACMVEVVDNS